MTRFEDLLGTDFEGNPTDDVDDVIYGGYDHPEHRERVADLIRLLDDTSAGDQHRYLACLTLAAWGKRKGTKQFDKRLRTRAPFLGTTS